MQHDQQRHGFRLSTYVSWWWQKRASPRVGSHASPMAGPALYRARSGKADRVTLQVALGNDRFDGHVLGLSADDDQTLSVAEAARLLGRDRTRVYALLRSGDLVFAPVGLTRGSTGRGPS
jgi:hypothetical protein